MSQIVLARRKIYAELYRQRVDNPGIYLEKRDLAYLAEARDMEAALCFGVEMGHIERFRGKSFYRLSAAGMLWAEQKGYLDEEY